MSVDRYAGMGRSELLAELRLRDAQRIQLENMFADLFRLLNEILREVRSCS